MNNCRNNRNSSNEKLVFFNFLELWINVGNHLFFKPPKTKSICTVALSNLDTMKKWFKALINQSAQFDRAEASTWLTTSNTGTSRFLSRPVSDWMGVLDYRRGKNQCSANYSSQGDSKERRGFYHSKSPPWFLLLTISPREIQWYLFLRYDKYRFWIKFFARRPWC